MYVSDENFAEVMGISLLSLLEINKHVDEIHVFIVEDQISAENKEKLIKIAQEYNRQLDFIPMPENEELLRINPPTSRWKRNVFARLFLDVLFSKYPEVNKVLYLDGDILVTDSLEELWNTDITNYLGAACLECMSNFHKWAIGAKKTDNYINTGMLLMNVVAWREQNVQEKLIKRIYERKGKVEYPDQDIFNSVISNQFILVSPRYNLTALAYDFTYKEMLIYRKPQFGYSEEEWKTAVAHPALVHFNTSFLSIRPWFEGSKHPYAELWRKYHANSPWRDTPMRKMKNYEKHERIVKIYHAMPSWLAVRIAGFMHSYVKPINCLLK